MNCNMTIYDKCQQAGDFNIHNEYTYICQNGSGTIELPLIGRQIMSICRIGNNDVAVNEVANDERVYEWMNKYSDEQICDALRNVEIGARRIFLTEKPTSTVLYGL